MRKIVLICLLCFILVTASVCFYSINVRPDMVAGEKIFENSTDGKNSLVVRNADKSSEEVSLSRQVKRIYPMVFIGYINISKENVIDSDSVWVFDGEMVDEKTNHPLYDDLDTGTKFDVDLMNCAGYVTSANIVKEGNYNWKLKFSLNTVSNEAVKKLKKCGSISDNGDIGGEVFAIAPQDAKRQNIIIDKINTSKVFASLPDVVKKLANDKINLKGKYRAKIVGDESGREKDNLSSEDIWTDLNGDGQIDLIGLSGQCDKNPNYSCTSIFLLTDGRWKRIGYITPA